MVHRIDSLNILRYLAEMEVEQTNFDTFNDNYATMKLLII